MRNNAVIYNESFYCIHINDCNDNFSGFTGTNLNSGFLVTYIQKVARKDESSNTARTYIVLDSETDEIVAYFSLKAGFVSFNEIRRLFRIAFDTIPSVELANFAVNGSYIKKHPEAKGIGNYIIKTFILPIVKNAASIVGVKLLYIFALPHDKLIKHYNEIGFSRLPNSIERQVHKRIKPRYDRSCIFMYMPL
ncbi:MAG: hypothetical protein K6B67_05860 [Lachnospiraceae bacterium]|nr:hypothetical protein [Lachnospiraceae bacterium]